MKGANTNPASPAWRTALSTGAAALLALACTGLPLTAATAQSVKPQPALVKKAQAAARTMDQLADLERQANASIQAANALAEEGRDSQTQWQRFQRSDQQLQEALTQAKACLPELRIRLTATGDSMTKLRQTLDISHAAVQGIARADEQALTSAAQRADAAFHQRGAAEQALNREQQALQEMAAHCASLVRAAQWATHRSDEQAHQFVDQARRVVAQRQALHQRWQATTSAFEAAVQTRPLAAPSPAAMPPDGGRVDTLARALAALTRFPPAGTLRATPAGALTPSRANLDRLWTELARQQDAVAYIDANTAPDAGGCSGSACAAFAAERRDLVRRIADTQDRLNKAVEQWRQAPEALSSQVDESQASRQARVNELAAAGAALEPAVAQTLEESQAIAAAAQPLRASAQTAYAQARREWQTAYRKAYGHAPEEAVAQTLGALSNSMVLSAPSMAAMMAPDIRSHAFELFSTFDGEIEGFGAYTYVLVRSASDMEVPSVRRRFNHLLASLQKLPNATLVPRDQAQNVNVFCIPVVPGGEDVGRPTEVRYASDLGQQLKMRAQNGLLTQKAVRHRLTSAPGPFLITLPTRLAKAQSASPVLIADLSTYPEDAITDLATHYMNGLVDNFPRQQALWMPPVLQRVALFMIHLAEGTGQLVTSAMPTALAGSR